MVRQAFRALRAGLRKEARDHRGVFVMLAVALPVLGLGGPPALGLRPGQVPGIAVFVLPAAQLLFLVAVGCELFAGERRRGTLDFLRRLPGGLRRSLAAKLVAYVIGSALAIAWGWIVAWAACAVYGPRGSVPGSIPGSSAGDLQAAGLMLSGALVALGCWMLLVSAWIPRAGAAVLGAPLLLALLLLPAALALGAHPWLAERTIERLARGSPIAPYLALAAVGAAAVLALAVSHLRGERFVAGSWAPAWRGLAVGPPWSTLRPRRSASTAPGSAPAGAPRT
jgi:hypothetical protein